MWLKPSSGTLTSHLPMTSNSGNRDNSQSRRNEPRSGQGQGQGSGRSRQGHQANRPNTGRNAQGDRGFRSKPFNPPAAVNGNGSYEAKPSTASLPQVEEGVPRPSGITKLTAGIEPFELFCAYHLGITPDRGYKPSNINEVANRFRVDPATIKQALKDYDMDPAALLDRDFDMALGQLDIQVAPEGVDRRELAKNIYEEFLEAETIKRDWGKILEEDRKENQKIFKS